MKVYFMTAPKKTDKKERERKIAGMIQINRQNVEEDVERIESAAFYLKKVPLDSQDMRSTIPANAKGKTAYDRSQERISGLGKLLDQEAENIRELNAAFEKFDEMMGRFAKNVR